MSTSEQKNSDGPIVDGVPTEDAAASLGATSSVSIPKGRRDLRNKTLGIALASAVVLGGICYGLFSSGLLDRGASEDTEEKDHEAPPAKDDTAGLKEGDSPTSAEEQKPTPPPAPVVEPPKPTAPVAPKSALKPAVAPAAKPKAVTKAKAPKKSAVKAKAKKKTTTAKSKTKTKTTAAQRKALALKKLKDKQKKAGTAGAPPASSSTSSAPAPAAPPQSTAPGSTDE